MIMRNWESRLRSLFRIDKKKSENDKKIVSFLCLQIKDFCWAITTLNETMSNYPKKKMKIIRKMIRVYPMTNETQPLLRQ